LLDANGFRDNSPHCIWVWATFQATEQKTGKVGMHALVMIDEFIGECEAMHETALLQPEYGRKRAREKHSFDGGKS
jgi:hypothetical protein